MWLIDALVENKQGRKKRIREFAPLQNKRAAEQYERDLCYQFIRKNDEPFEEVPPIVCPVFGEFSKRFIEVYAATNNKPSELQTKRCILKTHLLPAFAGIPLDRIDSDAIEEYKARNIKENLSKKTINNQLTVLRKMLVTAAEWRRLASVRPFRWLKAPRPDFFFLSFDEASRLIDAADPEWRCMIIVGLRTGRRLGELLALRWTDVDLKAGRLMVKRAAARGIVGTPKSGRWREVPLSSLVAEELSARARSSRSELVFESPEGRMFRRGECRRPLWRACERAGLRRCGWHVLRHTFASHLAMKGVPLSAIKEQLGHATIEMTMRYAHLEPTVVRAAVKLFDGFDTYVAHGSERPSVSV